MSNLAEKFIEEALKLPLEERAELADMLLQSLNVPTQQDVDKLWMKEVEKRIEDYDNKKVQALDGDKLFKEIRSQYKK